LIEGEFSSILALLDHFIRPREDVRRNSQADLLGRFQVDHHLKLHRLFRDAGGEFLQSLCQSIFNKDLLTFYVTKLARSILFGSNRFG
jgi:hypothetical protein